MLSKSEPRVLSGVVMATHPYPNGLGGCYGVVLGNDNLLYVWSLSVVRNSVMRVGTLVSFTANGAWNGAYATDIITQTPEATEAFMRAAYAAFHSDAGESA